MVPPAGPSQSVLKKIYFIKRARKGEELTTLLKNKFKSIDAIRDLLMWYEEGRDFVVGLRGEPTADGPGDGALSAMFFDEEAEGSEGKNAARKDGEQSVVISPWLPTAKNYKNLIDVIATIIAWMDMGRDFDITLSPQGTFDNSLN